MQISIMIMADRKILDMHNFILAQAAHKGLQLLINFLFDFRAAIKSLEDPWADENMGYESMPDEIRNGTNLFDQIDILICQIKFIEDCSSFLKQEQQKNLAWS